MNDHDRPAWPSGYHEHARDGDRPLAWTGWILGTGRADLPGRIVRVVIGLTTSGRIVTGTTWARRDGERAAAGVSDTPSEALGWLRRHGKGKLGAASLEAWREACEAWPALAEHAVELVE